MSNHDPETASLVAFSSHTSDEILDIFMQVMEDRGRQDEKWGTEFKGRRDSFWLTILVEEVGELAEAILKGQQRHINEEAIQVAAVIFAMLELGDRTPEAEVEDEQE